mmetsp:Transcript_87815/g.146654  ORF Transcript_87815/g.146654 Transcript_87815/m.146654 type:complete len:84 (+) Transcript_87815:2670-2921(+)
MVRKMYLREIFCYISSRQLFSGAVLQSFGPECAGFCHTLCAINSAPGEESDQSRLVESPVDEVPVVSKVLSKVTMLASRMGPE